MENGSTWEIQNILVENIYALIGNTFFQIKASEFAAAKQVTTVQQAANEEV